MTSLRQQLRPGPISFVWCSEGRRRLDSLRHDSLSRQISHFVRN
jgi:hypothetical protein